MAVDVEEAEAADVVVVVDVVVDVAVDVDVAIAMPPTLVQLIPRNKWIVSHPLNPTKAAAIIPRNCWLCS